MSDEDEKAGSIALSRPEEEALRLKTLAEEKYASGNLRFALKYAKRAHKVHPSLDGLPEMITALKILHTAAAPLVLGSSSVNQNSTPDYYKILQVERFSHLNTIKKQYKKLALTLHPDKNPFAVSAEAFKLVGEAACVLSDRIRRKEYDMRLRIAMQEKAAEKVGLGAAETFWTVCSACRLLHQFERKYIGHNLVCPKCKISFEAKEVKEATNNGVYVDPTRVSARIRERYAKNGCVGIVEKCGLGVKRKISSVVEDLEKMTSTNGGDDILLKDLKSKRVEKLVNGHGSKDNDELRRKIVEGKVKDVVQKESDSGEVEIVESERTKRPNAREEDTMTLLQMKVLVKKEKKQVEGNLMMKENGINGENLKVTEKEGENGKEEEKAKEEMAHLTLKTYKRRVRKDCNVEIVNITSVSTSNLEMELEKGNENGDGEVKEKEMDGKREKRERRRVSKYGDWEEVKREMSTNHEKSEIERIISKKKGNLEIMPVEDSDFHDFDKDRKGRSFRKGQVWAVYDDDDGMPRHYALIDEIISVNPFEVTLTWLLFQTNGEEELITRRKMGFPVSCGSFKVSRKISINYMNLFSHVVDCERVAREVYRIYPAKGSVWALYTNIDFDAEKGDKRVNQNRCYDTVLCLSSHSDIHGLSVGYLEKVPGFRAVFKRKEIGVNGVLNLGKNDVNLFSHQIPAKKLSGKEDSGLPKNCWELDPASLTPQLLLGT